MSTTIRSIGGPALLGVCLLISVAPNARAQGMSGGFSHAGNPNGTVSGFSRAAHGPSSPYSMMNSPYGMSSMTTGSSSGYGSGSSYQMPDAYGGYLQGAAGVIGSQGRFLIGNQQSFLIQEQVRRAQLDNSRAGFDNWRYRRDNIPTLEDERVRSQTQERRRSSFDLPPTEVWSGKTLNVLLTGVQKNLAGSAGKAVGVNIPIDQDIIKNINVTSGKNGSNIGVFKNEGVLNWPLALRDMAPADELRRQMDELAKKAYEDAVKGRVDSGTVKEMNALSNKLQQLLVKNAGEIPFSQYNTAKRFLGQLDDGVKALSQPDASNYVNGRYALRGRTIADIVQHMTENGLIFAPASAGGEPAYQALQRAFASYAIGANEAARLRQ